MKKIIILCLTISVYFTNGYAQKPDWIDLSVREVRFPHEKYLSAFVWNDVDKKEKPEELIEILKNSTRDEIASSIRVQVKSMSISNAVETNNELNKYFKHTATSFTNIELSGVQFKTYYDKKKKRVYVLGWVEKSVLSDYYLGKLNLEIKSLESIIRKADSYKTGNTSEAYRSYLEAGKKVKEIESLQNILLGLQIKKMQEIKFDKLETFREQIDNSLFTIQQSEIKSINDLAFFISDKIHRQLPNPEKPILLVYFTFGETQMTSQFSNRLLKALQKQLTKHVGYKTLTYSEQESTSKKDGDILVLTGSYLEDDNYIKISAVLKDLQTGSILAVTDDKISKTVIHSENISYKPENFDEAYSRMQAFSKDEIIGGGMKMEVWTNKGKDNLLFIENDTLRLFIRSNKAAYIRAIYYLADGSKVLLLDNFYINKDKVNKVYEIPEKFICAPPYGIETLQLSAQTKPFNKLNTYNEYGYTFICDGLDNILSNTRGFKRISEEDLKAETRLTITTIGR